LPASSITDGAWPIAKRCCPRARQLESCVAKLKEAEERLKGKTRVRLRCSRLLCEISETLRRRLGPQTHAGLTGMGQYFPCHAARRDPGNPFRKREGKIPTRNLGKILPAFQKFRGEEWMQDPLQNPATAATRTSAAAAARRYCWRATQPPRIPSAPSRPLAARWMRSSKQSTQPKPAIPRGKKTKLPLSPESLVRLKRPFECDSEAAAFYVVNPNAKSKFGATRLASKSGSVAPLHISYPPARCTHGRSSNAHRHTPK